MKFETTFWSHFRPIWVHLLRTIWVHLGKFQSIFEQFESIFEQFESIFEQFESNLSQFSAISKPFKPKISWFSLFFSVYSLSFSRLFEIQWWFGWQPNQWLWWLFTSHGNECGFDGKIRRCSKCTQQPNIFHQ